MPDYIVESDSALVSAKELKEQGLTPAEAKERLRKEVDRLASLVEAFQARTGAAIDIRDRTWINTTLFITTDEQTAAALAREPGIRIGEPRSLNSEKRPPSDFTPG